MLKCPLTSTSTTKVSLGKFYIAIDKNLQARGLRPDNAYRFIERIATSNQPRNSIVKYGLEDIQLNTVQLQVKECTEQIKKLVTLVNGLKKENAETVKELQCTKHALRDVTNEVKVIKKQWAKAAKEATSLEKEYNSVASDCAILEESIENTREDNLKLSTALGLVQMELSTIKNATTIYFDLKQMNFSFETKSGSIQYLPAVRKLYYLLLAQQIPPAKISTTIKAVLELQMFLNDLQQHPEAIMNKEHHVFISEESLYTNDAKLNYGCHPKWKLVHTHLFSIDTWDSTLLFPIIIAGVTAMERKLATYAHHQLPGGIYWDLEPKIKAILSKLEPSNDICESILGLNDYLSTAMPNMHQVTRSNLIEVKKNKTMQWLDKLPQEKQERVLDLAVKRRRQVLKERKEDDIRRGEKRREHILQAHSKRQALEERSQKEKDKLSELHLITTPEELSEVIQDIDKKGICETKKISEKLKLLKTQISIRKKVLKQDIHIAFTHSRKQRPVYQIIQELSDFIDTNKCDAIPSNPSLLIGKAIRHKFQLEDTHEEVWYDGRIIDYDSITKQHQIVYDGDDDSYSFDLCQDIVLGDLIIC